MTREEQQEYMRSMLTGHHEDSTHNHYADAAKALDVIIDEIELRNCANCIFNVPRDNYCLELENYGMKYCSKFVEEK